MSKKTLVLILVCMVAFLLNVEVKAACSSKTGDDIPEGCSAYSCNDTNKTDCKSHKVNNVECCKWPEYCCKNTNGTYTTKTTSGTNCTSGACKTCCCSGVTTTKPSCGNTCGTSACITIPLKFNATYQKVSNGKSVAYQVVNGNTGASITGWTLTATGANAGYVTITGGSVKGNNTSGDCQTVNLVATKTGDQVGSYTSVTTSIKVYPKWRLEEEGKKMPELTNDCDGKYGITELQADQQGLNVYRVNCENKGKVCYCDVWKRSCGDSDEPSPACYINKKGYMEWGLFNYDKKACKKGNKFVVCSGASDETPVQKSECHSTPNCDSDGPNQSDGETPCNGQGENDGEYEKYCKLPVVFKSNNTTEEQYIYDIKCKEKIALKFDGPVYDWTLEEENNAYLYPGTGFKYKLIGNSRMDCDGKFYKDNYDKYIKYIKDYQKEMEKIADVSTENETLAAFLKKSISDFADLVDNGYIKWDPNYTFDAKAILKDLKAEEEGEEPYEVELVRNKATEDVEANTTKCGKLLKDTDVKMKDDYTIDYGSRGHADFKYCITQYFEKIVPEACIDLDKGEITYGGTCSEDYSLGAQFFIMANRDFLGTKDYEDQDYNYMVDVSEMGFTDGNGSYATNKTTCRLVVINNKIIYRHVDTKDPFLKTTSPNRVIGLNWLNKKYNFTGLIKPETWKQSSLYSTIRLDEKTNREIKKLTKGNNATVYYVRKCKDNASTICQLVKNAKK